MGDVRDQPYRLQLFLSQQVRDSHQCVDRYGRASSHAASLLSIRCGLELVPFAVLGVAAPNGVKTTVRGSQVEVESYTVDECIELLFELEQFGVGCCIIILQGFGFFRVPVLCGMNWQYGLYLHSNHW
jgi:hypothetical protein